jgi:hypothetical protein
VPEQTEVLDGAYKPKKITVTRHDIAHQLTALLKRGFTTTSAGGFFLIPYLLQLSAYDLVSSMGPEKSHGVPKESLALGIVFESIFGYTQGIRSVDSVSRVDFGLLAGLPFLPSVSTQYRYLQSIPTQQALDLQVSLGRRLVELHHIQPGLPVNLDAHNIKTYSRKAMKLSFITKEGRYGKAIRTFYTQDQKSKKLLMALVAYSGTSVSQATGKLMGLTKNILAQDFMVVADKEWYCGKLIHELHKRYGITVLVPAKNTEKRVQEFQSVPFQKYKKSVWGNIATIYTDMNNFDGPLLMFLKKRQDGKYFALLTSQTDMSSETAMPTYRKRWRIENFFKDNSFLGIDRLPSLNLNTIQSMLSLRLLAFHAVDNFRHDLGPHYQYKTPELIYREFIDGVQGRVQLRGNVITVSVYGFEHQEAAASILMNLPAQLSRVGIDPRIPWLADRRLQFEFH